MTSAIVAEDNAAGVVQRPALILIVDDEQHNRQLLEVMLKPDGFEVVTANSGAAALAVVADVLPDLMLLDVMMPDMDGCALAASLKSNPRTRNIPIIMVTALDNRDARMLALHSGAEDFLTKPVDRAELCVRVRNLLRLKSYGAYYDKYSQTLEREVVVRTTELVARTKILEEQAAVLSEQAALLDLATDAIFVADMDHRIVFWSRGADAMYGWTRTEAIGHKIRDLLRTEFPAPVAEIDAKLLEEGHWAGEVIHYRRDGTSLNVSTRWALQRDATGSPQHIMAINSDITSRKVADAERVALTQKLAAVNAEQLRFKDEFISHVSHELRSPLTAIKQFSTILHSGLAGDLNDDQREYQGIVLRNIAQLQAMIDDLLEVTRLETGKLSIETESVCIPSAVADVFNTLKGIAAAKGVTLACDVPSNLVPACADPTRLRQILIILVENAIKFTPAAGQIDIRVRRDPQNSRSILFEVSDTGCGIPPGVTDRIFERLFQVTERVETSRKGLGLGLYICKELVTRQGGQICAVRRPEGGSTFTFDVPVFSLDNSLAGLFVNEKWPSESVAVLMVETCLLGPTHTADARQQWSNEARTIVKRCLLPDLDVFLPTKRDGSRGDIFFLAAFADENGASVLGNRIREQFARLPVRTRNAMQVSVSFSMVAPFPPDPGDSVTDKVTSMARNLEASMNSQFSRRAICS